MKKLAALLLLTLVFSSLEAQNPLTRRTNYTYDFGTDSYILDSEFVVEHNEAGQEVFSSFTRWYTWGDSLIIDYLFDQIITYHPDGSIASTLDRNFDQDTIRRANYQEFDIYGNAIKDSSFYQESVEISYTNSTRRDILYDSEGRILENQEQYKSSEQDSWLNTHYSKDVYNTNGCLEKSFSGQSAFDLYNRTTHTYTSDCQPLSILSESWDSGSRKWVNASFFTWTYTTANDSTFENKVIQNWDPSLEDWVTESEAEVVKDALNRQIRSTSKNKNGRQTRSFTVYNAQGERDYFVSENQASPTAAWVIGYEYELVEKTALREQYWNRIGFDTSRNAYRYYALITKEVDQKGRLLEDTRRDSSWNRSEYLRNYTTWSYDYEDFCDGLTQSRLIKRGEEGLSPQPVTLTEYSYLTKVDCQALAESIEMQIAPNPAQNFMILESELLQQADVRVQIVDHLGRILFSDAPGERQSRYNVPIESLQVGTYILQLTSPTERISRTFIKY